MNPYKILITGTSRGIGFNAAIALAKAGHTVFATMRNPAKSPALAEHATSENLPIHISAMDVDSDESVSSCIHAIYEKYGEIDVLINNAGIEKHGSVEELSMDDFKAVMETNYFGVLRCMKAVIPKMRAAKKGCIINIASVAGKIANPPLAPYCASKFALEAVTEAMAAELKPFNIRTYIVEPGIIDTDMAHDISDSNKSIYPHVHRFAGMFLATLQNPASPNIVSDAIVELIEGDSETLRHPVGPDSLPFLEWRASMTDEEWIQWNSLEDEEWFDYVLNTFGLDARAALGITSVKSV
ncbi:SDR family oxidoreductase [Fulvivirga sedimenti]|uniref:SDR family oxidoreductase n=1 Tax=Fulvivirga sedimenti TaxID=2879465 RepID=A0A9X1HP04_9BACT|nr:SDR family oxidoreductase [Fulvivirga sedimenti]MCA6074333.1 SDR family oxidoreductase [Fulvivirga sedimenti]